MDNPRRPQSNDRTLEEQMLFEQLNAAAQRYRDAQERTKAALALYTDMPWGHPDRDHARCLIAEERALEKYHEALNAFTDLVVGRAAGHSSSTL